MSSTLVYWLNNALVAGAALLIVLLAAWLLSRQSGRVLGVALRVSRAPERAALQAALAKQVTRAIAAAAMLVSFALIAAFVGLSAYEVEIGPRLWAATRSSLLADPAATLWIAGSLLALAIAAVMIHVIVRSVFGFILTSLGRTAALAEHGERLALLQRRLLATLRWLVLLIAVNVGAAVVSAADVLVYPLTVATYVILGVMVARTLATMGNLAVDVAVLVGHGLEGRTTPLRYLSRLDHLAGITKRTIEYFCFVGAATWISHQLRPDTWLSQTGVVAIRLGVLFYVGRVVIEVFELALREVLLAEPERRSEAEQLQLLTLVPVASSVMRYGVYFCLTVMGLQELGVDTSPILAGAGLLGLAVGLGAQAFVGDVVSGFFILFEGLFLVGDRIRVGEVIGEVEEIGVRVLKIRDEAGVLHCIPNGEVRSVANHARFYVNAIVDFGVPYDESVPRLMERVREHLAQSRGQHADMLGEAELVVQELREAAVVLRCVVRVKPGRDDAMSEVLRAEILAALVAAEVTPQACHVIKLRGDTRVLAGAARSG